MRWGRATGSNIGRKAAAIRYATPRTQRFALSASPMGEAVDYERAEQLVQVVLWHQAYSPMIAYVGVKSSKGGELGPELFIQQLESENRWREEQGFCLQGLTLFYFSHVKLAEFSCSGCFLSDLIWLLSSSLLLTPLFIFLVSFYLFFFFLSFPYFHIILSSFPLPFQTLFSTFPLHLSSAALVLIPPSLSPPFFFL